jgi:hypothetical protein
VEEIEEVEKTEATTFAELWRLKNGGGDLLHSAMEVEKGEERTSELRLAQGPVSMADG